MTLTAKYSNDVGKALSIGIMTKGDVPPQDQAIFSAPTDTLMELSVVVSLYFPLLTSEVQKLMAAHGTMMMRFDEIIDARGAHHEEDAAAFYQRFQKEITPSMEIVRS